MAKYMYFFGMVRTFINFGNSTGVGIFVRKVVTYNFYMHVFYDCPKLCNLHSKNIKKCVSIEKTHLAQSDRYAPMQFLFENTGCLSVV